MIDKFKTHVLYLRKKRSTLGPTMQFHLSEIANIGKRDGNRATTDTEALQYIKKTVAALKTQNTSNKDEIDELSKFLPNMASEEEIRSFLSSGVDLSNKGVTMKALKNHFGVNVDMKRAGQIAEEMRNGK